MKCKNCKNYIDKWCDKILDSPSSNCERNCKHYKTKTNYDHIRNMSIEEMATFINGKTYGCIFSFGCPCNCGESYPEDCVEKIKKWLEMEVEE